VEQRRQGVVQLGERGLIASTGAAEQTGERIAGIVGLMFGGGAPTERVTEHVQALRSRCRHRSSCNSFVARTYPDWSVTNPVRARAPNCSHEN
jgi:hypothetical protein